MNRTILTVAGAFSASSLLLVDSAVKGTALLGLAAVAALILRRDSAATRHLVWLLATVAMLVVPVLSAMLPQWRVLPEWAGVPPKTAVVAASPRSIARPAVRAVELPRPSEPLETERPSAAAVQPAAELPARPALVTAKAGPAPTVQSWRWINALPLLWVIGFSALLLRLCAARWMLWSSERQGTVIGSSTRPEKGTDDPIVTALEAARLQLGINRPVTLLMHPDKTIPVVWGIFRNHLLLPAAARDWSGEQLRSVLLHELAHVKRRDMIAQLLAQIACALHWFNPLVWLAAWRLSVERERACDDLVLASGVRPSTYAGHLLEVVTNFAPARGMQSCGLAMARKLSIEGRLVAVLSKSLNRRRVSVALVAIALAMTAGIAVPLAMLRAADEKPGEKPKTESTDMKPKEKSKLDPGLKPPDPKTEMQKPGEGKNANVLSDALWETKSPLEKIPVTISSWSEAKNGLRIGMHVEGDAGWRLGGKVHVELWMHNSSAKDISFTVTSPNRSDVGVFAVAKDSDGVDHSSDVGNINLIADEGEAVLPAGYVAKVKEFPLSFDAPDNRELAWFAPKFSNLKPGKYKLRCIWCEAELDEPGKGRWTGRLTSPEMEFNLAAGNTPAAAEPAPPASHDGKAPVAPGKAKPDEKNPEVPKAVSQPPAPKAVAKLDPNTEQRLKWGEPVNGLRAALVIRTSPVGPNAEDTPDLYLLVQNVSDAPIHLADTIAAPNLRYLTVQRDDVPQSRTRIDVPTQTDATLEPREATFVLMCPRGERASRGQLLAAGMLKEPHMILVGQMNIEKAPAGAWTGTLVSSPTNGAGAQIDPADARKAPAAPDGAKPKEGAQSPKLADRVYAKSGVPLDEQSWPMPPWGVEKDGLSSGIRVMPVETHVGGEMKVELWVRNSGAKDVKFNQCLRADVGLSVTAKDSNGADHTADITSFDGYPVFHPLMLPPGHVVKVKEFTVRFDAPGSDAPPAQVARLLLPGGSYKLRTKWSDAHSLAAREGEWTGEIESAAVDLKVAAKDAAATPAEQLKVAAETPKSGGAVQPKPEAAQLPGAPVQQQGAQKPKGAAKLQPATEAKLEWGEPVNGLRMALAWPPALGEPAAGDVADFYLAVQNGSKTAVRLCTTVDAPHERWLDIKEKDRIVSRIGSKEPNGVDVTLQPQEVAFLRLFQEAVKDPNNASAGAAIASDIRQSTRYQLNAALKVDKAPAGAWTGTVTTPNTRAGVGAEAPKNRKAQELLKVWLHDARLSGKIPGGFIALLGEHMKAFVKGNAADAAGAPFAKRMEPLLPRLDGSRDWQPVDAAALLNDIAAVSDAPLSVMLEEIAGGKVQHGLPLPQELEKAPWGEPIGHGLGLRTATIVGPGVESRLHYVDWIGNVVNEGAAANKAGVNASGAEIPLGTPLGSRILIHNAGKEPVVFRTRTWHHIEPTAKDAKGAEIATESITRYTRAPLITFRLEPGRYIELASPGFGLGKYGFHDFKNADIASWIGAKEGDDVSLTPGVLPLLDWNEERTLLLDGEPRWWLDFIAARLSLVTPLPSDAAERKALLRRVMWDIYLQGTDPTEEESAAFVSDTSTQALTKLAERLLHRTGVRVWAGPLQSGPTKFRVLPADPRAPKPPEGPAAAPAPASPAAPDKPAAAPADDKPNTSDLPKGKEGQALFKKWQEHARGNGNVPGGLVGRLGEKMKEFISLNTGDAAGDPYAKKMERLVPRCDATRDWTPAEIAALMADITAITPIPLDTMMDEIAERTLKTGSPLPPSLANAPWGEAKPEGLRMAWLFEPRAVEYRIGTPLKSRILLHNSGKNAVVFRTRTLHQVGHTARDAKGADIKVSSVLWTAIGQFAAFRLEPGEFVEVTGPGIGVGAMGNAEDWQNTRVGSWVEAKQGDDITLTTAPILVSNTLLSGPVPAADWKKARTQEDEPDWWLGFITARLSRELPLPASAEERTRLLNRAVRDLFGTAPTAEETAAFLADGGPNALDSLAKRLEHRPGLTTFSGKMTSGPTKFRVLAADPDAAKRPRTANNPDHYTLGESRAGLTK